MTRTVRNRSDRFTRRSSEMKPAPRLRLSMSWMQFLMGVILIMVLFNISTLLLLQSLWPLEPHHTPKLRVPDANAPVPPLLISPPQHGNQFQSFQDQCINHCLSAYTASPLHPAPTRLLHFIFIGDLAPGSFVEFTWMDYLVIRAAYMRLQPKAIYLHLNQPPKDSPLWDLIAPMITRQLHLEPITEIYGHQVTGRAHFSDIARLQILQQYGGMYMDIDSLSLRPFPPSIWYPPSGMTMGYENAKEHHIGCGVIVAETNSSYLRRWLESYKTFNDERWADHTVLMAGQLAQQFPTEIDVLPETHFYRPSWYPESIKLLWEERPKDDIALFQFRLAYAPHYWGTFAREAGKIQRMTPFTILHENVGIHQILRPLLPHPYFTLVVSCPDRWVWRSILQQTFGLFEVLVEPNCPRPADSRVRIGAARGVWQIDLARGRQLQSPRVLERALDSMRQYPHRRVHYTTGGKEIQFIFDPTKGMTRYNQSTTQH